LELTFGLSDIHPETFEIHSVKLLILGHQREDVGFDRSRLDFDTVKDRRVEDVDTSVDTVSDVLLGLLDESVDGGRVGVGEDYTVFRGFVDLGDLLNGYHCE
jgi:hypothetical protein